MRVVFLRLLRGARWLFQPETLCVDSKDTPLTGASKRHFLLQREVLPLDPETPTDRSSKKRFLLQREVLPLDPEMPTDRVSKRRFLLQREVLPLDPETPRSSTGGALRFLFANEDLDRSDRS